jgi:hypothetical protein
MASIYLIAAIAFIAGIAVGWLIANTRAKSAIQVSMSPPGVEPASASWPAGKTPKKIRTMEIKCVCGSVLKFRDPPEPGYQPCPTGNSVTCPNCGRDKDLSEIRQLEKDARG